MKYSIENLLKDDNISCHEVRATTYNNHHILLHFFITKHDDDLPKFQMGYERYKCTMEDIEHEDINTDKDNLQFFSLITSTDHPSILFTQPDPSQPVLLQKNEWTGEQPDIGDSSIDDSLSPLSSDKITINKNLRYVSEMADNSIYRTDDIITEKTYLEDKDTSLQHLKNENETISFDESFDNKTNHSIWNSSIHFNKFEICNSDELLELFKKYKSYIGLYIKPDLDTESNFNIDMEKIFGASFDIVRIKTRLFNKDDDDEGFHLGEKVMA